MSFNAENIEELIKAHNKEERAFNKMLSAINRYRGLVSVIEQSEKDNIDDMNAEPANITAIKSDIGAKLERRIDALHDEWLQRAMQMKQVLEANDTINP